MEPVTVNSVIWIGSDYSIGIVDGAVGIVQPIHGIGTIDGIGILQAVDRTIRRIGSGVWILRVLAVAIHIIPVIPVHIIISGSHGT